jgi:predicted nucleic acid-binding protein
MLANGEHLTTSRFNVAELLVGVYRSDDPERELRSVDALLQNMTVLEFGPEAARWTFWGRTPRTGPGGGSRCGPGGGRDLGGAPRHTR